MKNKSTIFNVSVLSSIQTMLSLLFKNIGSLFFFSEERSEVLPVKYLVSQGGNEELMISLGFFIFLPLSIVSFVSSKIKSETTVIIALFIALFLQTFSLSLIEVASIPLSISQPNGWVLAAWLFVLASLWIVLIISFINKITRSWPLAM